MLNIEERFSKTQCLLITFCLTENSESESFCNLTPPAVLKGSFVDFVSFMYFCFNCPKSFRLNEIFANTLVTDYFLHSRNIVETLNISYY